MEKNFGLRMCPGVLAMTPMFELMSSLNPGLESAMNLWGSVVRDKSCGSTRSPLLLPLGSSSPSSIRLGKNKQSCRKKIGLKKRLHWYVMKRNQSWHTIWFLCWFAVWLQRWHTIWFLCWLAVWLTGWYVDWTMNWTVVWIIGLVVIEGDRICK